MKGRGDPPGPPGDFPTLAGFLPLRLSGDPHHEEEGPRADLLFRSMTLQGYGEILSELVVAVPPADLASAEQLARSHPTLPLRVLPEEEIEPLLRGVPARKGSQKQMLLKLAYTAQAPTDFVLTLDADLLACRPARKEDLVRDGRAVTEWEPRKVHPGWWRGSGIVLALPWWRSSWGMSVTPAVLAPYVAALVFQRLRRVHGTHPVQALLRWGFLGWTEYTAYHLVAERHGLLETHHTLREEKDVPRLIHPASVWFEGDLQDPDAWMLTDLGEVPFLVVQSRARISLRDRRHILTRIQWEAGM